MDNPKVRPEVLDFANKYDKFLIELEKLRKERAKHSSWDSDFEMMNWKFQKTIVNPMELSWQQLTDEEKTKILFVMFP